MTLDAYRVGADGDLVDPSGTFAAAFGVGADGAALVRPDGVLAWRSPAGSRADAATLTGVMKQVLARA